MTAEYQCLDLFAGLGGFSQAFRDSDRWSVTTVDHDPGCNPDRVADISTLLPSDFEQPYDVVLASPPCTELSSAASRQQHYANGEPQTDAGADALALVYHTVGLIEGLAPTYWILENPMGKLRKVYRPPETTVTMCQYGFDWMKSTDLWGDLPPMDLRRCGFGDDCHVNSHDAFASSDETTHIRAPEQRAKLPIGFSTAVRDGCERGLDDEVPEQQQLDTFNNTTQ